MADVVTIPKENYSKAISLLDGIRNTTNSVYTEHRIEDIIKLLKEVKPEEDEQGK